MKITVNAAVDSSELDKVITASLEWSVPVMLDLLFAEVDLKFAEAAASTKLEIKNTVYSKLDKYFTERLCESIKPNQTMVQDNSM